MPPVALAKPSESGADLEHRYTRKALQLLSECVQSCLSEVDQRAVRFYKNKGMKSADTIIYRVDPIEYPYVSVDGMNGIIIRKTVNQGKVSHE